MYSYSSGPAVGVENGTNLIGWPCRIIPGLDDSKEKKFLLVPVAVSVTEDEMVIYALDPTGLILRRPHSELQFDPKWVRK